MKYYTIFVHHKNDFPQFKNYHSVPGLFTARQAKSVMEKRMRTGLYDDIKIVFAIETEKPLKPIAMPRQDI